MLNSPLSTQQLHHHLCFNLKKNLAIKKWWFQNVLLAGRLIVLDRNFFLFFLGHSHILSVYTLPQRRRLEVLATLANAGTDCELTQASHTQLCRNLYKAERLAVFVGLKRRLNTTIRIRLCIRSTNHLSIIWLSVFL